MERVTCDLCGSRNSNQYFMGEDCFFHIPGFFSVVKCESCGFLYTNPRPTEKKLLSLYKDYYDQTAPVESSRRKLFVKKHPRIRAAFHALLGQYLGKFLLSVRGKVLDIGCGQGDLMEEMRDRGCYVQGVEPNHASAMAALNKGFQVHISRFEDSPLPDNNFDVIVLWHVLEHTLSARTSLIKSRKLLREGGRIFFCQEKERSCGWSFAEVMKSDILSLTSNDHSDAQYHFFQRTKSEHFFTAIKPKSPEGSMKR